MHWTHLSLHHVWPVEAQIEDDAIYVCHILCVQLLQHPIQDNKGSRSAHSGTKTQAAHSVKVLKLEEQKHPSLALIKCLITDILSLFVVKKWDVCCYRKRQNFRIKQHFLVAKKTIKLNQGCKDVLRQSNKVAGHQHQANFSFQWLISWLHYTTNYHAPKLNISQNICLT